MRPIRIVIADERQIFRDVLRRVLDAEPGMEVVGEASTGRDALARVAEQTPDILLLDLRMPDGSGLDVLRALDGNPVRVIVLTGDPAASRQSKALALGARGVVPEESAAATLTQCIPAVFAGEYWFGRDRLPDLVQAVRHLRRSAPPAAALTPREQRVVAAVLAGCTNRETARALGLSEQTVKNYLSRVFAKIGVSTRLELALYAIDHAATALAGPPDTGCDVAVSGGAGAAARGRRAVGA